jgi:hypothetical protein
MALPERIRIGRVLTGSPLSRQHDRLVNGAGARRIVDIPWSRFDRSKYPAPALALACNAQTMLAQGEYEAVDLFARITSVLAVNGAPIDLVAAATRAASDEIRHADYAFRFAALLGGNDDVRIDVRSKRAEERWAGGLALGKLDLMIIDVVAIGEALACALITGSRTRATDPVARALYTSILGDEVHHTRLGWYYLAWRAPHWTAAERQAVADRAGELLVQIERRFWWGRDAPAGSRKAARALGVLESEGQRKVVRQVMEEEIVPALDELGLGGSLAWNARLRGGPRSEPAVPSPDP